MVKRSACMDLSVARLDLVVQGGWAWVVGGWSPPGRLVWDGGGERKLRLLPGRAHWRLSGPGGPELATRRDAGFARGAQRLRPVPGRRCSRPAEYRFPLRPNRLPPLGRWGHSRGRPPKRSIGDFRALAAQNSPLDEMRGSRGAVCTSGVANARRRFALPVAPSCRKRVRFRDIRGVTIGACPDHKRRPPSIGDVRAGAAQRSPRDAIPRSRGSPRGTTGS